MSEKNLTCFEVETYYKSGRTRSEILSFATEEEMWSYYDKHHNASLIDSSAIIDAWTC